MLNHESLVELIADPIVQAGSLAVVGPLVTRVTFRNHPTGRLVGQVMRASILGAVIAVVGFGIQPVYAGELPIHAPPRPPPKPDRSYSRPNMDVVNPVTTPKPQPEYAKADMSVKPND